MHSVALNLTAQRRMRVWSETGWRGRRDFRAVKDAMLVGANRKLNVRVRLPCSKRIRVSLSPPLVPSPGFEPRISIAGDHFRNKGEPLVELSGS